MSYKTIFLTLAAWAIFICARAQSSLENVLAAVEKNNPSLAAARQLWEAKKLEYQTGLSLPNPTLQGQYLFGSPSAAGNQTDFFAVQSFDFPSTYRKRRELAAAQGALSAPALASLRQDVLLEAQLICLDMVYRNKLAALYEGRYAELEELRRDFQTSLDEGGGNILDLNKTRLQLLEVVQLQRENDLELQKLQIRLTGLNGGGPLSFQDTIYPPVGETGAFDTVEQEFEAADPMRQSLEQEKRIAEKQVELSKSWRLPKFEAGYHYQAILGQRFSGAHLGLTLPLWEQKYRDQQSQAQLLYSELHLQSHRNEHFFEIKELYERQAALKNSLDEYRSALASSSNKTLLDKALRLGEVSTIEYFLEMSFYWNASLHVLNLEREYHSTLARLMQYKL